MSTRSDLRCYCNYLYFDDVPEMKARSIAIIHVCCIFCKARDVYDFLNGCSRPPRGHVSPIAGVRSLCAGAVAALCGLYAGHSLTSHKVSFSFP